MFSSRLNNTNLFFWYWWILLWKASPIFVSFSRHVSRTVFGTHFPLPENISYSKSYCLPLKYLSCISFPGIRTLQTSGTGTACKLFKRHCSSLFKAFKKNISPGNPPGIFPVLHLKDPQAWLCFGKGTQKCGYFHSHPLTLSEAKYRKHARILCIFFWKPRRKTELILNYKHFTLLKPTKVGLAQEEAEYNFHWCNDIPAIKLRGSDATSQNYIRPNIYRLILDWVAPLSFLQRNVLIKNNFYLFKTCE